MPKPSKFRSEKGAELVEFALILPLILLLCLGVIEFGRAYYTYNILSKAVRDGARYASAGMVTSTGTINSSTVTETKNVVVYGNTGGTGTPKIPSLTTTHVNVPATTVVTAAEQYVTVSVSYPYVPLFKLVMPATLTISPKVTMIFVGRIAYPTS
jgi:Flp pilus assembly protein TadG